MIIRNSYQIVKEWVIELSKSFDGQIWSNNGPTMLTKILKRFCKQNDLKKIRPDCGNLTIYDPEAFYPIHWNDWEELYEDNLQNHRKDGRLLELKLCLISTIYLKSKLQMYGP